MLKFEL